MRYPSGGSIIHINNLLASCQAKELQGATIIALEKTHLVQRPEAHESLADKVVHRDGTDVARVSRIGPVVPHDKDVAFWYGYRAVSTLIRPFVIEVRLLPALSVHVKRAADDLYVIPRYSYHPLYEIYVLIGAFETTMSPRCGPLKR